MMEIRPVLKEDFAQISEIYHFYVEHTAATFEEEIPSAAELLRRYEKQESLPFLVSVTNKKITGFAYVRPYHIRSAYRFTVENSVYVDNKYLGKGIGRALLTRLFKECQHHNIKQIIALIAVWDGSSASIKLHKEFGFEEKGCLSKVGYKFNKFIDTILMQKEME